jgi:phosphonate transport system ATP-binding protein
MSSFCHPGVTDESRFTCYLRPAIRRRVTAAAPPFPQSANKLSKGEWMLEIDGLSRSFGTKVAVAGVSLQIDKGAFVGVIGRSGAGKSTLLRLINRLVEPNAGRVVFDGLDITALRGRQLRQWRARAAMVFQQFNLIGRLDVLTNVLIGRLAVVPPWRALLSW